jgi:hypothetical protein
MIHNLASPSVSGGGRPPCHMMHARFCLLVVHARIFGKDQMKHTGQRLENQRRARQHDSHAYDTYTYQSLRDPMCMHATDQATQRRDTYHTCFSKENKVHNYMHVRIKFQAYSDI